MKKQLLISILALAASSSALANGTELEVGYQRQNLNFEGDGDISDLRGDLRFGAAYVSFGYRMAFSDTTSGTIEANYTLAVSDDELGLLLFDNAESYGVGYRITQKLDGEWSLFGRVDYRQWDIRVQNFSGGDPEFDEAGLGLGVGLEWRGLTFGYTVFTGDLDDIQTLNVGYRFRFGADKW